MGRTEVHVTTLVHDVCHLCSLADAPLLLIPIKSIFIFSRKSPRLRKQRIIDQTIPHVLYHTEAYYISDDEVHRIAFGHY